MGFAPASGESGRIIDAIEQLPAEIALLIIDHDMDLVFRLARRITVLVQGRVLVEGPPAERHSKTGSLPHCRSWPPSKAGRS